MFGTVETATPDQISSLPLTGASEAVMEGVNHALCPQKSIWFNIPKGEESSKQQMALRELISF